MRQTIRVMLAACLYYSGLVPLARWWTGRSGKRLIILGYHRASGGNLRQQLLYLRRHYRILSLESALRELYEPDASVTPRADQRALLAITFDDGYYDNFTHLRMLARELQIPVTIFLIPGYIETGECFWWLEPDRLVSQAQVDTVTVEGRSYHLASEKERTALARAITTRARHAKSIAERETFLASIRQELAAPSSTPSEALPDRSLTWVEIQQMEADEWISFGAHTMHHPVLAQVADESELRREIYDCRVILEQRLKRQARTFAYPMGKMEDIGSHVPPIVRQLGYQWALTTMPGSNTARTDPHMLRRVVIGASLAPDDHWLLVAAKTAGLWNILTLKAVRLRATRVFQDRQQSGAKLTVMPAPANTQVVQDR
jgi:peptidoglycan/xylan/chitin deacetylase (PgdA/CDA1 family)